MNKPLQIIGWRDEKLVLWASKGENLVRLEELLPYLVENNIDRFQCGATTYQEGQLDLVVLYEDLVKLPYLPQILLSRWLFSQTNGAPFEALSEGEAMALFKSIAPQKKYDIAVLKTLLQGVDFAMPAVILLAQTFKQHASTSIGAFVETLQKYTLEKDGVPLPILRLFQASNFTEEELFVLGTLALLPALPISREMYAHIVHDAPAYLECLPTLVQKGWVASHDLVQFQLYAPLQDWVLTLCPPSLPMQKHLADTWLVMLQNEISKEDDAPDALLTIATQGFLEKFAGEEKDLANERIQLFDALHVAYLKLEKPLLAVDCLTKAMTLMANTAGKLSLDYTNLGNNLAVVYAELGQFEKSIPLGEEVLQLRAELVGERHILYRNALQNLGDFYQDAGDKARATPLLEAAEKLSTSLEKARNDSEHQQKAQRVITYMRAGKFALALPLHQEIMAQARLDLGTKHPEFIIMWGYLAYLYEQTGDSAKSLETWQEIAQEQARLGEAHPDYLMALNNVAVWYVEHGRFAEAKPLLEVILQRRRQVLGEMHPDFAISLHNLGTWHKQQGQYTEAKPYFERAYALLCEILGEASQQAQTVKECLDETNDVLAAQ